MSFEDWLDILVMHLAEYGVALGTLEEVVDDYEAGRDALEVAEEILAEYR